MCARIVICSSASQLEERPRLNSSYCCTKEHSCLVRIYILRKTGVRTYVNHSTFIRCYGLHPTSSRSFLQPSLLPQNRNYPAIITLTSKKLLLEKWSLRKRDTTDVRYVRGTHYHNKCCLIKN